MKRELEEKKAKLAQVEQSLQHTPSPPVVVSRCFIRFVFLMHGFSFSGAICQLAFVNISSCSFGLKAALASSSNPYTTKRDLLRALMIKCKVDFESLISAEIAPRIGNLLTGLLRANQDLFAQ